MEKVVETIYFVRYNIFCFFVWNGRSNFFFLARWIKTRTSRQSRLYTRRYWKSVSSIVVVVVGRKKEMKKEAHSRRQKEWPHNPALERRRRRCSVGAISFRWQSGSGWRNGGGRLYICKDGYRRRLHIHNRRLSQYLAVDEKWHSSSP